MVVCGGGVWWWWCINFKPSVSIPEEKCAQVFEIFIFFEKIMIFKFCQYVAEYEFELRIGDISNFNIC